MSHSTRLTYRKILCLPTKFPTALLYLPTTHGGIGLPRISDKAQLMKWESLLRCSAVHGDPAITVINALLSRVPLPEHTHLSPTQASPDHLLHTIPCPSSTTSWPSLAITSCSLIEWAHESKLLLACRTGTTSSEDIIAADHNTIAELAYDLDLWPDPRRSNELCDCTLLRLFATDGSYEAEPKSLADILTPEKTLRDQGKGAGGIVFIPHRKHLPTMGVRITSTQPEPGMNAFTWELLTQVIALHMIKYQPLYLPGFSDCTSAIARVNLALRSHINSLAHTRGGLWASGAHTFSDPQYPRQFHHIKAHPDRDTKRRTNPTIRDKAIFMADAVAGQTKEKLGTHTPPPGPKV